MSSSTSVFRARISLYGAENSTFTAAPRWKGQLDRGPTDERALAEDACQPFWPGALLGSLGSIRPVPWREIFNPIAEFETLDRIVWSFSWERLSPKTAG